jgi:hypothetical protein
MSLQPSCGFRKAFICHYALVAFTISRALTEPARFAATQWMDAGWPRAYLSLYKRGGVPPVDERV